MSLSVGQLLALWLWLGGVLLVASPALAQPTDGVRDSAAKAVSLYRFCAFVSWPSSAFRNPADPLVIGVLGDEAVAADLEQVVAGRLVAGRPVIVRRVVEPGAERGLHMLFLGRQRDAKLRRLLAKVDGPVLTVTDQQGALAVGSVINFVNEQGRIRFSASLTAAEQRSLRLSTRLLAVAYHVEGRSR